MVLAVGKVMRSASIANHAKDWLKRCKKKGYSSILQRLQHHDVYREYQQAIGWTEDICRHLDE